MEAFGTGAAANIISEFCKCVIGPLVQLIKDVIHLDRNTRLLQEKLETARSFLVDTDNRFRHQQRSAPAAVTDGLQRLRESLEHAERIKNRSQQRQGCLDRSFCKPRLCRQIRKCSIDIEERCIHLRSVISTERETQEIASSAPLQAGALLQTVPPSGYVGSGIISAEKLLNTWLEDAQDHQFRVIGVFGMGGIGKTSLLKEVYNSHKKGNVFEVVIWLTISQKFSIPDLQSIIAKEINLDLGSSSSNAESISAVLDMQKMRISNYLKEKKFFLILDDMWNPIQLEEELGIPFGNDKGSKVVISTRSRDVIHGMKADDYSIAIQPLSTDEGWQLFYREAFKARSIPTKEIRDIAQQIAEECKGLPLAINVVAAAMRGNTAAGEWHLARTQMKTVDPNFLTYKGVDKDLYRRLQWSYDRLNDCKISNLQNCFLYCGAFSEDANIEVERLVEMWIGEEMVNSRDKSLFMDEGRRLAGIPGEICQLTSLNKLELLSWREAKLGVDEAKSGMCSLKDFTNFPNLMELRVRVKPGNTLTGDRKRLGIKLGIMGTWLEMKHLTLDFDHREDVMEDLPHDMQNMKNLHSFDLREYGGISLPNCICDFERLEVLSLNRCYQLQELPPLERLPVLRLLTLTILSEVRELGIRGFPMLERLTINMMDSLESISNVVWTEATLPKTSIRVDTAVQIIEEIAHRNREALQFKTHTN